jgi:hypothetical protein
MSALLRIYPLSLNVLVYTHVSVGVFMRAPFFLSCLVDSTVETMRRMLHSAVDAWLYFPGLKVGKSYLFFLLFDC